MTDKLNRLRQVEDMLGYRGPYRATFYAGNVVEDSKGRPVESYETEQKAIASAKALNIRLGYEEDTP